MHNVVTDMLGCRYPVILGAMGVICNSELVAAVSEAGGYGLLATAFVEDVEVLRTQIRGTKELTDKPFGANVFAMNPLVPDLISILAEAGECIAHENYKNTIVNARETGTGLVELGRIRVRALQTELVEGLIEGTQDKDNVFSGPAIEASWLQGDIAAGVLPAGEVSGLVTNLPTVKKLIDEMVNG